MPSNTYTSIWQRVIQPERNDLRPEVAEAILRLKFVQSDLDRMNLLAAKAREGSLTEAERRELEEYEQVGILLSIMQSKARLALKQTVPAA